VPVASDLYPYPLVVSTGAVSQLPFPLARDPFDSD
jgi:hypothetical protein